MTKKAPLRVAVVGLGIGRMHLEALEDDPDAEVVALCDRDAKRLASTGRRFGVAARYDDLHALLTTEAPDALVIATPNHLHEPMVLAALEAGCHVLCEKPLAHTWESACAIADAARGVRRLVMLDLSFRFGAEARTAHAYLESGVAGRLYHASTVWARTRGIPDFGPWFLQRRQSGGGPVIDLAVHRLDLALWLLGNPKVEAVSAMVHGALGKRLMRRKGLRFDVEDLGVAMMRLAGGRSLILEASWAEHSGRTEHMETRILGEEGGATHRNVGDTYDFVTELYADRNGRNARVADRRYRKAALRPAREFVRAVREGRRDVPTWKDGLRLAAALEALYRSASQRREVSLSELEG